MMVAPSCIAGSVFLTQFINALGNSGTVLLLLVVMFWIKFDGEAL